MKKVYVILSIISVILFCIQATDGNPKKKHIKASEQRSGDPDVGYDYLMNGDYVSSGIPVSIFGTGSDSTSFYLNRQKQNHTLPPQFTHITKNSVEMVAPNCLSCHGDYLNGEYIVGLGNSTFNYAINIAPATNFLSMTIKSKYGQDSDVWKSYSPFDKATKAINPKITTETRGVNPADKLTAVLVAHRDPETLTWRDTAALDIPDITIPTDIPPWWVLKKKNAMFYTAIGRGDFSRFLMASSILTMKDTTEARAIDDKFPDVLAWINTIEPPKYPAAINESLAAEGEMIFYNNCSGCHGTYGESGKYPNYLVSLETIGTDRALSDAYTKGTYRDFINWYESSWFSQGEHPGKVVVEEGYVAQPLDGIWASAPYLHNGSVPTVEALLNSKLRPQYWKRSYDSYDYNYDALGWNYEVLEDKQDNETYDTTIEGYGNEGHLFGDKLMDREREAVIEYLKTL
jgi:mono/diheme cytochrome c family protein